MSAMSANIRIYPASELSALDMAELMDAALLRNGILQGCGLSVSDHDLNIDSGRMVIKGRLAVITGGTLTRPDDILTPQDCYVTAVCDLTAENPFDILILKEGDHASLVGRANNYSETTFNVNSGVWLHELGTCRVHPTSGVTSVTPIATDQRLAKNRSAMSAGTDKTVAALNARENEHWDKHELWRQQLTRRQHSRSNFLTKLSTADGVNLPANTMGTFVMRKEYDSIVRVFGPTDTRPGTTAPHIDLSKQYAYNGRSTGTNPGILEDSAGSVSPHKEPTYDPTYSIPTNVNDLKIHYGIQGIQIDNATKNGAGSANCVLQSFYTDNEHIFVKIRNTGSSAAVLKISVRSLYIVDMDF